MLFSGRTSSLVKTTLRVVEIFPVSETTGKSMSRAVGSISSKKLASSTLTFENMSRAMARHCGGVVCK